jgi:enamine deaminase RidA (YjgF/YER057c/UK114 family)
MKVIQPEGWPRPRGYVNGMLASGEILHVSGQIGWDIAGQMVSGDLIDQFARALDNVLAIVEAAGGGPTDVADMTVFVTDVDAYRNGASRLRDIWKARFGDHYPAMALLGISALVHPQAKVEIQATAHL